MNHKHVKTLVLLAICCVLNLQLVHSQTIWPGDITNNGVVNGIDLLYHGIAADAEGSPREVHSPDWVEFPLPPPWFGSFADGTNFAFADCNGDGKVDNFDYEVITSNYGQNHEGFIPDVFTLGNPVVDPSLLLEAITPVVTPGGIARIKLSLGDENFPINDFFGIVFTLHFNPDLIADQANNIRFRLKQNSFVNGSGPNRAKTYTKIDDDAGTVEMTIMRQSLGTADGFGEIGTFIIVMEDIILLQEENVHFSIGDIKMIDPELNESLVAASELDISIQSTNHNLIVDQSYVEIQENVLLFSKLSSQETWIEVNNHTKNINKVELQYNNKEVVFTQDFNRKKTRYKIDLSKYPKGNYALRIYTKEEISQYLIIR